MALIQPVSGNFDSAQLNSRTLPIVPKRLKVQDPKQFPPIYVFNVGPRRHEFPPNERGGRFLEACPKGAAHSKPLLFRCIEMEIYDLADGGGNMGLLQEEGLDKALALIHGGPAGDGLSIDTPNLEWHGVFVTENEEPTARELKQANDKLRQYRKLVYDRGSALRMRGHVFPEGSRDPDLYNEAAEGLGKPVLFGIADHTMDRCLFCKEIIQEGALKCKSCGERLDTDEAKKLRTQKTA